jgi:hypothetical protein
VTRAGTKSDAGNLRSIVRRAGVALLSLACRTWIPFLLLGTANRALRRFDSVFFCYAGNQRYAEHYSWSQHRTWLLWFPSIIGVFKQGGRWGLICASPVTEPEFMDCANAGNLAILVERLERVRKIIGARQLSMAGVLPSFLGRASTGPCAVRCTDHTAHAVRQAVREVSHQYLQGQMHQIVILGGAGRVGRAVHALLREDGVSAAVIDTALPESQVYSCARAASSASSVVLLVDVSRHGALEKHLDLLPAGSIVVNDVFPEPDRRVLELLRARRIGLVHLSGVKAKVVPPLPHGYLGAVPCCAIHAPDSADLVLQRLA